MLKKVWVGILLILMINFPGLATGQDVPSGKWWYNQKVVKNLNLTQKEIRQLDQAWVDSQRKLIKLKNAVESEQFELDTMLGKVADFYEEEVDDAVAGLSSLLEPIIMAFLGTVIGGLVIAMYLPIFKMASAV